MDLEYPNWQEPLAAAILEFNPQQLREKLQIAEQVIARRIQELGIDETSKHELRLLYDALSLIRGLKHNRLDGSACKNEFGQEDSRHKNFRAHLDSN